MWVRRALWRSKVLREIALSHAVAEMYDLIVDELDPQPRSVAAYCLTPSSQEVARIAVRAFGRSRGDE